MDIGWVMFATAVLVICLTIYTTVVRWSGRKRDHKPQESESPEEDEPIPLWDGDQRLMTVKDENGNPHLITTPVGNSTII